MKLKLAPGKIAVKKIEVKLKGGIALPATRAKAYDIAEITEVGCLEGFGHEKKESTRENFKVGDIILFQLPLNIAAMSSYTIKGTLNLFLNVTDIIARLDNSLVELKSFHVAGKYLLLKPQVRNAVSPIIIPDSAEQNRGESLHFSVLQMGADVTIGTYVGQEVFPHRGRINPLVIDNEETCFVDQVFIDGTMEEESSLVGA